jgi:hypothetical protein
MSFLSSVASITGLLNLAGTRVPSDESTSTKPDDCGHGKLSKWNDDHSGNDDFLRTDDGKDNHSKVSGIAAYPKDGKGDYPEHDGGWKDAKDGEYQPKDYDDGGRGETDRSPGEVLAKCDFSHGDFPGDFSSHGPDHSGDIHGALASMSSDDALEYAIGLMGPTDYFDVGHFDTATDTSHDTDA